MILTFDYGWYDYDNEFQFGTPLQYSTNHTLAEELYTLLRFNRGSYNLYRIIGCYRKE